MSTLRRNFLKTLGGGAALSVAGLPGTLFGHAPAIIAARARAGVDDSGRKLGYCIVGLGRISMGQFMPGVQISERSKLVAFVSGHRDKAEREAAKYGVDPKNIYDYAHYDEIAHNPAIDAVYIALPNNMHAEYTIRAARAGKHVLTEKPMANSPEDCEAMIAACRKAGKKLMVAYRCQYEPTNLKAIELIRSGALGKVQIIESSFGFNIGKGEWRLDKRMAGGGPMVDVGIYSLKACRYLTGEEPTEVRASCSVTDHDGRFNQVEETLGWNMQFPSGIIANCSTSYGYNGGNWVRVMASKGWLHLEPAFSYDGLQLKARAQGMAPLDFTPADPSPHQFAREADHLAGCVFNDKTPKTPGEEGLRDTRLIHAIYHACATDRPVTV